MRKSRFKTPSGRTHRSGTKRRPRRAGRMSNLRAPRPARLPNPKPTTTKIKPAHFRHERGASGAGQNFFRLFSIS